jgi:iron-sulfur cluster repair protein YtfE (RIC family)
MACYAMGTLECLMLITDALLGEHAVLHAMFIHLDQTLKIGSLAELKSQGSLLAAALSSHAELEEELLFARLEPEIGAQGPLAVMRQEHEVIDGSLVKLKSAEEAESARQLLSLTVNTAKAHFLKEERVLFPMACSALTPETLAELGTEWAKARGFQ